MLLRWRTHCNNEGHQRKRHTWLEMQLLYGTTGGLEAIIGILGRDAHRHHMAYRSSEEGGVHVTAGAIYLWQGTSMSLLKPKADAQAFVPGVIARLTMACLFCL